jgi:hypothetical protein
MSSVYGRHDTERQTLAFGQSGGERTRRGGIDGVGRAQKWTLKRQNGEYRIEHER